MASAITLQALRALELELPCTVSEAKSQYKKLAKEIHPDLNPDNPNASAEMAALTEAYNFLAAWLPEGAIA